MITDASRYVFTSEDFAEKFAAQFYRNMYSSYKVLPLDRKGLDGKRELPISIERTSDIRPKTSEVADAANTILTTTLEINNSDFVLLNDIMMAGNHKEVVDKIPIDDTVNFSNKFGEGAKVILKSFRSSFNDVAVAELVFYETSDFFLTGDLFVRLKNGDETIKVLKTDAPSPLFSNYDEFKRIFLSDGAEFQCVSGGIIFLVMIQPFVLKNDGKGASLVKPKRHYTQTVKFTK